MVKFTILMFSEKMSISFSVSTQSILYVNLNIAILLVIIYILYTPWWMLHNKQIRIFMGIKREVGRYQVKEWKRGDVELSISVYQNIPVRVWLHILSQ